MPKPLGRDPVDIHAGERLRVLRRLRGETLDSLAGKIGVTYQQLQKYESAANRMAISTMYRLAGILKVPAGEFFAGLPDEIPAGLPQDREELEVLQAWRGIASAQLRRHVVDMMKALNGN